MPGECYTLYSKVQWWIRRLSRWHTATALTHFPAWGSQNVQWREPPAGKKESDPSYSHCNWTCSGRWAGWLTLWWLTNFFIQIIANKNLGHHSNCCGLLLFTEVIRNSFFLLSDHTAWPHWCCKDLICVTLAEEDAPRKLVDAVAGVEVGVGSDSF